MILGNLFEYLLYFFCKTFNYPGSQDPIEILTLLLCTYKNIPWNCIMLIWQLSSSKFAETFCVRWLVYTSSVLELEHNQVQHTSVQQMLAFAERQLAFLLQLQFETILTKNVKKTTSMDDNTRYDIKGRQQQNLQRKSTSMEGD